MDILAIALCAAIILISCYIISQRRKNEKKLIDANKRYVDLINNIQGGVITCVFDKGAGTSKALYVSDGWRELTGYTLSELNDLFGGNPQSLVHPDDMARTKQDYTIQTSAGDSYKLEYRITKKGGNVIWVMDHGIVTTDGKNTQNQSIITEVTDIKEKEAELWRLTQTDPLSGLHNKTTATILAQNIVEVQKHGLHALMVVDIDDFKGINDNLGHIAGDAVISEVSSRLKQLFRVQDEVGRIGGDEFLVVMTNILSRDAARTKASDMCQSLCSTYSSENGSREISCSVGVAFSDDAKDYNELFKQADIALYKAKINGKNQYAVYSPLDGMMVPSTPRATP